MTQLTSLLLSMREALKEKEIDDQTSLLLSMREALNEMEIDEEDLN